MIIIKKINVDHVLELRSSIYWNISRCLGLDRCDMQYTPLYLNNFFIFECHALVFTWHMFIMLKGFKHNFKFFYKRALVFKSNSSNSNPPLNHLTTLLNIRLKYSDKFYFRKVDKRSQETMEISLSNLHQNILLMLSFKVILKWLISRRMSIVTRSHTIDDNWLWFHFNVM